MKFLILAFFLLFLSCTNVVNNSQTINNEKKSNPSFSILKSTQKVDIDFFLKDYALKNFYMKNIDFTHSFNGNKSKPHLNTWLTFCKVRLN